MHRFAPAFVLALAAGCASISHDAIAPLAVLRNPDLHVVVEPTLGSLRSETSEASAPADEDLDERLGVWIYRVDRRVLESVPMSDRSLVGAATCSRTEVDRWLESVRACGELELAPLASKPALTADSGSRAFVCVTSETAFIRGFELQQKGDIGIADPRIDVIAEGLLLEARAEPASGGASEVSLDLTLCELDRPIRERVVRLTAGNLPLTVQEPSGVTWTLSLRESLADDEVLVLTGRGDGDEEECGLLALVRLVPADAMLRGASEL
jgi:hypothetical protein